MNLAKESFYTLMFQVSGFLCATITGMIVARALGPANKGIITIALLCPSLFFTVFHLSVGLGMIHHMGKRQHEIKAFVGSALVLLGGLTFLALLAFLTTAIFYRDILYRGVALKYLLVAGLAIPFNLTLYFFSSILQANMEIKGYNLANQLLYYSNLLFVGVFLLSGHLTTLEAVVAGISGTVVGAIVAVLAVIKITGGISFDAELTKRLITDGGKVQIGVIAAFLYSQANVFILNYYAQPAEVGFYSVAFSLANILFFFSLSLEIGLYPKTAHASLEDAVELVSVATRQILVITTAAAVAMAIFSKYIVLIYGGAAFLPSIYPLLLLLPGVIVFTIARILSPLWVRKGWFLQLTLIAVGTALFSLVLNIVLIPKFGAKGAAMATTASYCATTLIVLLLFRKYVKKDLTGLLVPSRADISLYWNFIEMLRR